MNQRIIGARLMIGAVFVAIIILGVYAFVYQYAPFSGDWNDLITAGLVILATVLTTGMAFLLYRSYQPGDAPRAIWLNLTLGVCMFAAGEAIWYTIALTVGEAPEPSLATLVWFIGYIFTSIAVYHQYKILFPRRKVQVRWLILGGWCVVSLIALLIGLLLDQLSGAVYFNFLYPLADFGFCLYALYILWMFRGGALTRPWLGFFFFALSDVAYAIMEQSGLYAWSVSNGNPLSLAVDLAYLAAYLIMAIGFLGQYLLVRYASYSVKRPLD